MWGANQAMQEVGWTTPLINNNVWAYVFNSRILLFTQQNSLAPNWFDYYTHVWVNSRIL